MYVSAASGPIQPEGDCCKSDMSSQPIRDISEIFLFVYKDSYGQYVYVWMNMEIVEGIFNIFSLI
jgi:hypothetical protein